MPAIRFNHQHIRCLLLSAFRGPLCRRNDFALNILPPLFVDFFAVRVGGKAVAARPAGTVAAGTVVGSGVARNAVREVQF
jgi:hypothetical protein